METIARIIAANGGLDALKRGEAIAVDANGVVLEIEYIGNGPAGGEALEVSQYERISAGAVREPDMHFELDQDGRWLPFYWRDDSTAEERHVYTAHAKNPRLVGINIALRKQLAELARRWDEELKAGGFIEADAATRYYPLFSDLESAI